MLYTTLSALTSGGAGAWVSPWVPSEAPEPPEGLRTASPAPFPGFSLDFCGPPPPACSFPPAPWLGVPPPSSSWPNSAQMPATVSSKRSRAARRAASIILCREPALKVRVGRLIVLSGGPEEGLLWAILRLTAPTPEGPADLDAPVEREVPAAPESPPSRALAAGAASAAGAPAPPVWSNPSWGRAPP